MMDMGKIDVAAIETARVDAKGSLLHGDADGFSSCSAREPGAA
jgi:hypothetical protein